MIIVHAHCNKYITFSNKYFFALDTSKFSLSISINNTKTGILTAYAEFISRKPCDI